MKFRDLQIIEPIQKALKEQGYDQPTPIQEQSIPILLAGKDLLGCAQTGTGKQLLSQFRFFNIYLILMNLIIPSAQ